MTCMRIQGRRSRWGGGSLACLVRMGEVGPPAQQTRKSQQGGRHRGSRHQAEEWTQESGWRNSPWRESSLPSMDQTDGGEDELDSI